MEVAVEELLNEKKIMDKGYLKITYSRLIFHICLILFLEVLAGDLP